LAAIQSVGESTFFLMGKFWRWAEHIGGASISKHPLRWCSWCLGTSCGTDPAVFPRILSLI